MRCGGRLRWGKRCHKRKRPSRAMGSKEKPRKSRGLRCPCASRAGRTQVIIALILAPPAPCDGRQTGGVAAHPLKSLDSRPSAFQFLGET
jgi:hypothetical protein